MKYETASIHLLSHGAIPAVQSGRIRPASNVALHAVRVPNLMQMSEKIDFLH